MCHRKHTHTYTTVKLRQFKISGFLVPADVLVVVCAVVHNAILPEENVGEGLCITQNVNLLFLNSALRVSSRKLTSLSKLRLDAVCRCTCEPHTQHL